MSRSASAGDVATVEAILGAPAFLTGVAFDEETSRELRERAAGAASPEKLETLQRARAVETKLLQSWQAALALTPRTNERLEGLRARHPA